MLESISKNEIAGMIIVTAATPFETQWLTSQLTRTRPAAIGKFTALKGKIGTVPILIFNIGIGKTNAAHGATLLLEKFRPALILLIGCGGAYRRSGLIPGDLAIAGEEIFGDEGVITPQGWRSTKYLNLPLLRKEEQSFYNSFPMNQKIVNKAQKILQRFTPKTGPFVTVSEITGTEEKAAEMERRFRGMCENMEGAAVAHVCTLYDAPFLEIRGISNVVKQRNKREWKISAATRISQEAAREIITHWRESF
jgi:futalosine hydrolase